MVYNKVGNMRTKYPVAGEPMKNPKNLMKNITIMLLVALCITQTVQLWFGGFSSRNPLSSLFSSEAEYSAVEALASLVRPFRVVTPNGGGFALLYGDAERGALQAVGDDILSVAMHTGDFVASYPLDMAAILQSGGMLYEYAVDMPSEAFVRFFQTRTDSLSNRVRHFNGIALLPQNGSADAVRVVFIDESAGQCHEYMARRGGLGADLQAALNRQTAPSIVYYATALDEVPRFAGNMYYADWGSGSLLYNRAEAYSPYGEITIGNIERYVLAFFENPSWVVRDMDSNVFTYKDDNAVARYHPNNVLEFADYKARRAQSSNSFAAAYAAAVNMLQKDRGIVNEFYLSAYVQEGESWFFAFDYTVNGFPVYISQNLSHSLAMSLQGNAEMTHMIEVEVQYDRVYKYKRYGLSFMADAAAEGVKYTGFMRNIEQALEGSLAPDGESLLPIRSVVFGYRADGTTQLSLQWLIHDENGMPLPSFD